MNEDEFVPEGFKMTELGLLPREWKVVTLGSLNSRKKKTLTPADYPEETFEYYSIPAYQQNGKPVLTKGGKILSLKLIIDDDTVLFGKLNPRVEKVWRVRSSSEYRKIGSTEWLPIFPDLSLVDTDFLFYIEWSEYVMPIAKTLVTGSTPSRQRVDPKSFYRIKIPLPPLPEQKRIATALSSVQNAIEQTESEKRILEGFLKSLLHNLMLGKIRTTHIEVD